MDEKQEKELVKRIAKLVKQNKELSSQIKNLQESNDKLIKENEKFKELMADITPEQLEAAKKGKKRKSLRFSMATVLFADIHGFTKLSDQNNSRDLIDELDTIFFEFEQIVKKYNIEKIKTIGDTYMAAGGIPIKNRTNPIDVVMAALEMRAYLEKMQEDHEKIWDLRIGIHTGQVTAVQQGKKKLSYDIKGETVNTASRMEASCEFGQINISVMTYELVREFFVCEYYGKMPVKYQGDMEMYYVKGLRPELSENGDGITPNKTFHTRYGLIRFGDLQEFILDKLERELPEYLYYHNVKHTIDVTTQCELIGWGEGVSDEEILLLKTAGLFHDAGHTVGYDNHEFFGTELARKLLPEYNYSEEQIDKICEVIMATKLPPKPQTVLQKIICDADLDYLGRSDFIPVSNTLYKELKSQSKIGSLNAWNKLQVKFLSGHQFFTQTALSLREVNKQKQIERIKALITEDDEEAEKRFQESEKTGQPVEEQ